jgi:hypothetical protein
MNEFVFWQMPNDPDDDDDNPEKQEEFINSDESSLFIPVDLDQTGPSMFTKRSKTVKQKTGNFYCIVDYPYWGHHVKKNAPYCSSPVVVWKRVKSTKIIKMLDFNTL